MPITAASLTQLQNGSYYLSNSGEIKKAGLWQWFKCFTGLGDGRAKVERLVERIKTDLLASAGIKRDVALSSSLDELDTTRSISSADLRRIATAFKQTHSAAIAKTDAFHAAESVVDEVVAGWTRDKSIAGDEESVKYAKQLALYAARPIIDKAPEYGENSAKLVTDIKKCMGKVNAALGTAALLAGKADLGYPSIQSELNMNGRNIRPDLTFKGFALDKLHFRAILSCLFDKDGNISTNAFFTKLMQLPEAKLQRCKDVFLDAPLMEAGKANPLEKFLSATANVEKAYNDMVLSRIGSKVRGAELPPPEITAVLQELIDELRAEFGEDAIEKDLTMGALVEGQGSLRDLARPVIEAANEKGEMVSPADLKDAFREAARLGAVKRFAQRCMEDCLKQANPDLVVPKHLALTFMRRNPAFAKEIADAKSPQEIAGVVASHIKEVKDYLALKAKLDAHSDEMLLDRAAQKIAASLNMDVASVRQRLPSSRLESKAGDLRSDILDGKHPGCMEADFDIDAAFDEVVDRFVSEYVPVMKEIDAINGLSDKVKSAWKNILLTVQKPAELQVAKLAKIVAGGNSAEELRNALSTAGSNEETYARFCEWAVRMESALQAEYGKEKWSDLGSDGHMTIYELATAALVDQKPEIAAKFDAVRESLTNPPDGLQQKYDNRGASIAHAFAGNLDQALS